MKEKYKKKQKEWQLARGLKNKLIRENKYLEVVKKYNIQPHHYLGRVCVHGHEYMDSGMSLRYRSSCRCVMCLSGSFPTFLESLGKYDIKDNLVIGKPCKRGHLFKDSLGTLRNRSDRKCVMCVKIKITSERYKQWEKEYNGRPEVRRRTKENKRRYNQNESVKLSRRSASKKHKNDLKRAYVLSLLRDRSGLKNEDITPGMIEFKRDQLRLYRELKTLKKEIRNGVT